MQRSCSFTFGLFAILTLTWSCGQIVKLPEGEFSTECVTGTAQCVSNTVQSCVQGAWLDTMVCAHGCVNGACPNDCVHGDKQCDGNVVQECDHGAWVNQIKCGDQTCLEKGVCTGVCAPGYRRCNGNTSQSCLDGQWLDDAQCSFVCTAGVCAGECVPGGTRCAEQIVQSCDASGKWMGATNCADQAQLCVAGACAMTPSSCTSLSMTCGPADNENCCAVTEVAGGNFNRNNDAALPATVADFAIDRFEITVGRFRKFVEVYPGSKPAPNAGAHPLIPNSGWKSAWDTNLSADQTILINALHCYAGTSTWTDQPGANEDLPINCIDWYTAFAFCIWDGGRLPTEAEWNYVAAGGNEQRIYPWSSPPSSANIDNTYATYGCMSDGSAAGICTFTDIAKVGSRSPKGDGRWGQADLAGSVWEWTLDWYQSDYPLPCANCASVADGMFRVFRGGAWDSNESDVITVRGFDPADSRHPILGARCARSP